MRIVIALLKPLSFIPAFLMMYVIYTFSAQDAQTSAALSYQVSYKIVDVADEVLDADLQDWEKDSLATRFHHVTRKLAHMGEYFLLAIAVAFPLYVYGVRGFVLVLAAGTFCVAFACGDEYHQSFVAGRGPQAKDVGIDSIGIFAGILVVRIIGWTGRMTIFRPRRAKRIRRQEPVPADANIAEFPADTASVRAGNTPEDWPGTVTGTSPALSRRERRRKEKELQKSLPPSDRLSDELRPGRIFRKFR